MTPPQKPEWIEIADKDNSALPHKISKGLPVMALVVTASILGIGSIFAQSADESPANAVEISAPAVQSSQSVSSQDSISPIAGTVSNISFTPQDSSGVSPSAATIKNPSIGTMPTGGGDDEGEEDGDDEGVLEYDGDDDEGDDD
jgi:hypothetical protein